MSGRHMYRPSESSILQWILYPGKPAPLSMRRTANSGFVFRLRLPCIVFLPSGEEAGGDMPLTLIPRGTCTSPYRMRFDHHSHALVALRIDCGWRVLDFKDFSKPPFSWISNFFYFSSFLWRNNTRNHVVFSDQWRDTMVDINLIFTVLNGSESHHIQTR